ncbi:hypothetical protein Ahy_B09g098340 isoform C [Arachis hypogaea]|uniref:Uncharacterized protein n=1 Tax=Arachis hypogaea TaxID=3818 RepID=A0A444XR32_ARAHY|nr:hypothetical protein Ahy_B09g098340 isoform C [Arachis hypogaea]
MNRKEKKVVEAREVPSTSVYVLWPMAVKESRDSLGAEEMNDADLPDFSPVLDAWRENQIETVVRESSGSERRSDEISLLPLEELQEEADNTEMKTLSGRN